MNFSKGQVYKLDKRSWLASRIFLGAKFFQIVGNDVSYQLKIAPFPVTYRREISVVKDYLEGWYVEGMITNAFESFNIEE